MVLRRGSLPIPMCYCPLICFILCTTGVRPGYSCLLNGMLIQAFKHSHEGGCCTHEYLHGFGIVKNGLVWFLLSPPWLNASADNHARAPPFFSDPQVTLGKRYFHQTPCPFAFLLKPVREASKPLTPKTSTLGFSRCKIMFLELTALYHVCLGRTYPTR